MPQVFCTKTVLAYSQTSSLVPAHAEHPLGLGAVLDAGDPALVRQVVPLVVHPVEVVRQDELGDEPRLEADEGRPGGRVALQGGGGRVHVVADGRPVLPVVAQEPHAHGAVRGNSQDGLTFDTFNYQKKTYCAYFISQLTCSSPGSSTAALISSAPPSNLLSTPGRIPAGRGVEEEDGDCADAEEEEEEEAAVPAGGPPPPPPLEWSEVENGLPKGESSSGCSRAAILKGIEGLPLHQDGLDPLPLQRPLQVQHFSFLALSPNFLRLCSSAVSVLVFLPSVKTRNKKKVTLSTSIKKEGRRERKER